MNFVSYTFLIFYGIVFGLYWNLPHRAQNVLLLIASYVFYGWWDWRFLSLLFISSAVDYATALVIDRSDRPIARRVALGLSLLTNLGMLGTFKYFDFFSDSFARGLNTLGLDVDPPLLQIILPVGISFYTFQTLSYVIDVYRRDLKASADPIDFLLFVSFFPQLVAGPIERATDLLPQVQRTRTFRWPDFNSGMQLALVGFFKKTVIADNLAVVADDVYGTGIGDGTAILLATYAFAFQIYCDFSGYTDIARGTARMLGFGLCENFRLPYLATNPSDFWERWHISLSTWFRDYFYIPIGGNRHGEATTYRNLALTMVLAGLWHGASAHFVAWGVYHAVLLIAFRWFSGGARHRDPRGPRLGFWFWLKVAAFFQLTCYGWLLFRAESMSDILVMTVRLCEFGGWTSPDPEALARLLTFAAPLIAFQVYQYRSRSMEPWIDWPAPVRALFYVALFYGIVLLGVPERNDFIYFQF